MEKFKVSFEANNQQLKSIGTKHASDTYADIEATFVLGEKWTDMDSVSAVWWNDFVRVATVLDSQGKCIVPHEVLTRKGCVRVNLVGSIVEGDELITRLTSYSAEAVQVNEKIKLTGSETSEITPSQYEQFVANVKADADRTEAGADEAEASAQNASESASASAVSASDSARSATASAESAQNASEIAVEVEVMKNEVELAKDKVLGMRATAETLEAGSDATASYSDGLLTLGIPRGDQGIQGIQGETGATPNLTIGTVETLEPTEDATASITGTAEEPILNLGIPKGEQGDVSLEQLEDYTIVQTDTDNEPYISRVVNRVGHTQYDTLVGGTVNWNQKADELTLANKWKVNEAFGTATYGDNSIKYTITSKQASQYIGRNNGVGGFPLIQNHKYFIGFGILSTEALTSIRLYVMDNQAIYWGAVEANAFIRKEQIINSTQATGGNAFFGIYPNLTGGGMNVGAEFTISDLCVFDLTAMLGTTIADYIYSLEQTTEGAGVAWFKDHFAPNSYYPYDKGTLKSVQTSGHKITGKNLYADSVFDAYTYAWYADYSFSGTPKKTFLKKGETYTFSATMDSGVSSWNIYLRVFDTDGNIISDTNVVNPMLGGSYTMTYDASAHAFRGNGSIASTFWSITPTVDVWVNCTITNGNGKGNNAQIEFGSTATDHEPYTTITYPLDADLELRGIPKLDSSNSLYYDGDVYKSDGSVTRKYGIVDLGTLNWSYDGARWQAVFADIVAFATRNADLVAVGWVGDTTATVGSERKMLTVGGALYFYTADNANPPTGLLVYPKKTPTEETADPYTNPQVIYDGGMEEYLDAEIPVGHQTEYPMTLIDTIPSDNGTYTLKVTVQNGKPTVEWVASNALTMSRPMVQTEETE